MQWMFADASKFYSDISNWNVSKVTSMMGMFYHAILFHSYLNNWKVSHESSVVSMFSNAHLFPLESISDWKPVKKEQYFYHHQQQQQRAWKNLSSFSTKSSCL